MGYSTKSSKEKMASLENRYKQLLISLIDRKLPECRMWLFGSRARKTNQQGADIDLALDAGRVLTMQEIFSLKEAIEESDLPVFVDLVDIRNVSEDFLNQIKKEWIPWKQ
jgi:uncharacterized protein